MFSNKKRYQLPEQEKIDLIYSYNKLTPLFARKAGYELDKKNPEDAIDILTKGLKNFPDYAVPYLLLGKAYALKGNYAEAIENIKKGSDLIPSKRTYDFYLNEIENIKNKISLGFSNADNSEEASSGNEEIYGINSIARDEKLRDLVKEISPEQKAEHTAERSEQEKSFGKNIIVSETLAKIYISQGEYNEAIEIYNLLKEKYPDKVEYYSKKIDELKSKLD
ncbi:MAG: tetratricopeptide repeat protein [Ignavibacteriaceae bacterium]